METTFSDKNFAKIMYAFHLIENFIKIYFLGSGDMAYWDSPYYLLSSFQARVNAGQNIETKNLYAIPELKMKKENSLGAKTNEEMWSQMCDFEIWCFYGSERYYSGNRPKGLVTGGLIFMFIWGQRCGLGLS